MSKLKELEKRLREEPENLGLRVTAAGAMREAGRQAEAVELYRSVAVAYRDQGRSQQAIAVCRSILEIAPDDTRCHALLASLVAQHKGRASHDTAGPFGDEIVLEVGTPPPPKSERPKQPSIPPLVGRTPTPPKITPAEGSGVRAPTVPPQTRQPTSPPATRQPTSPPATVRPNLTRQPTAPPATVKSGVSVPLPAPRMPPSPRSSSRLDETPLPVPVPYHVADPTTRSLKKLSEVDLIATPDPDPDDLPLSEDAKTRPGDEDVKRRAEGSGLSKAARRISSALIKPTPVDLSLELDTRERPRIESAEIERVSKPPPTVPVELLDLAGDDDETAPPSITRSLRATDDDTEEEDEGVPTLDNEEPDEPTRPRDTMLDLMIRTENEGPFGSAFFRPLPVEHRQKVLARFHKKTVKKGTTVIRQGEVGHSLVVVLKGQLLARVDRKGGPIELGAVGTGEFVGEGSLLSRAPSQVQVSALTDCELLLLPPRDFYEVAGAFPALWAELKDVAERRKRELEAALKR